MYHNYQVSIYSTGGHTYGAIMKPSIIQRHVYLWNSNYVDYDTAVVDIDR